MSNISEMTKFAADSNPAGFQKAVATEISTRLHEALMAERKRVLDESIGHYLKNVGHAIKHGVKRGARVGSTVGAVAGGTVGGAVGAVTGGVSHGLHSALKPVAQGAKRNLHRNMHM